MPSESAAEGFDCFVEAQEKMEASMNALSERTNRQYEAVSTTNGLVEPEDGTLMNLPDSPHENMYTEVLFSGGLRWNNNSVLSAGLIYVFINLCFLSRSQTLPPSLSFGHLPSSEGRR